MIGSGPCRCQCGWDDGGHLEVVHHGFYRGQPLLRVEADTATCPQCGDGLYPEDLIRRTS